MADEIPEPDRIEGAPHPRATPRLFGHAGAEAAFLDSFNAGRLHHAWMITGARGLGKATLAWRIARFLLATPETEDAGMFSPPPPASLDIPENHPVARRMRALGEPRLFLLRRAWDEKKSRLQDVIAVVEVRKMKSFFALSAADGGRRVAIIDAVDEMNVSAANALLKLLEEPPARVTLLLIAHQPHRLLPTVRSRCRELRLAALPPPDLAAALAQAGAEVDPHAAQGLTELAAGSVGQAFRLTDLDGLGLYERLIGLMATLPRLSRPRALALAEAGAGRDGGVGFDLIVTLIDLMLSRLARTGTLGVPPPEAVTGEALLLRRLAPSPAAGRAWADLAQTLSIRARQGKAVNLDPAALLMDMVLKVDETAGHLANR